MTCNFARSLWSLTYLAEYIIIIIIIIIGSTALGGPWPSYEVLPIRLRRGRPSSNS